MSNNADLNTERDEQRAQEDSTADAIAAVTLIAIFVAAAIFWIAGQ